MKLGVRASAGMVAAIALGHHHGLDPGARRGQHLFLDAADEEDIVPDRRPGETRRNPRRYGRPRASNTVSTRGQGAPA
jgi:hypothetical protein